MHTLMKLAVFALCLGSPACGPILDIRDGLQGRVGPNTPYGMHRRDFWGFWHCEPHPWILAESYQRAEEEQHLPANAPSITPDAMLSESDLP